jgi:hypothetical protein
MSRWWTLSQVLQREPLENSVSQTQQEAKGAKDDIRTSDGNIEC